jgi:hypothetical protein
VTDAAGSVVQRLPDPAFGCAVRMDRYGPAGRDAAAGTYTLAVENWDGEDLIETRRRKVRATIEEAQLNAARSC